MRRHNYILVSHIIKYEQRNNYSAYPLRSGSPVNTEEEPNFATNLSVSLTNQCSVH